MIVIPSLDVPSSCRGCDIIGIPDLVGFKCPVTEYVGAYSFSRRPEGCPLQTEYDLIKRTIKMMLDEMQKKEGR